MGPLRGARDEVVFCSSKKSLASGLPMATVLLAGQSVTLIVPPLMLYHQIQFIVCATLAKRYANAGRGAAAKALGSEIAPRSVTANDVAFGTRVRNARA
jgi:sodium/bile acid cotransporter 7